MCTHKRAGGPDYNCLNQVIARGQFPQGKGVGAQTTEFIGKGTIVLEYTGDAITATVAQARKLKTGKAYLVEVTEERWINAKKGGNLSRYLNFSCEANCHLQRFETQGEYRIGVVACRDIGPDEELAITNWDEECELQCLCGSTRCKAGGRWVSKLRQKGPGCMPVTHLNGRLIHQRRAPRVSNSRDVWVDVPQELSYAGGDSGRGGPSGYWRVGNGGRHCLLSWPGLMVCHAASTGHARRMVDCAGGNGSAGEYGGHEAQDGDSLAGHHHDTCPWANSLIRCTEHVDSYPGNGDLAVSTIQTIAVEQLQRDVHVDLLLRQTAGGQTRVEGVGAG
eukprot:2848211-Rhodomonas_salina.3